MPCWQLSFNHKCHARQPEIRPHRSAENRRSIKGLYYKFATPASHLAYLGAGRSREAFQPTLTETTPYIINVLNIAGN
jgi:hypothetical protein